MFENVFFMILKFTAKTERRYVFETKFLFVLVSQIYRKDGRSLMFFYSNFFASSCLCGSLNLFFRCFQIIINIRWVKIHIVGSFKRLHVRLHRH
jgi:hypothetical protein